MRNFYVTKVDPYYQIMNSVTVSFKVIYVYSTYIYINTIPTIMLPTS